jgi:hypothetical protein
MNREWRIPLALIVGMLVFFWAMDAFRRQGWEGHAACVQEELRGDARELISREVLWRCDSARFNSRMGFWR